MSVEQNKKVVGRVFDEVVNEGRLDVIPELYSAEVVDHDPWPGSRDGIQGIVDSIGSLREASPDLTVAVEDMSADGDYVVVHNTWKGTQTGKLLRLPPSGRPVSFKGIVLWRLEDGMIVERWGMLDTGGMLRQTGNRVAVGSGGSRRPIRAGRRYGRRRRVSAEPVVRFLEVRLIAAGKADAWRRLHEEMEGSRRDETKESRRSLDVLRELVWGQSLGTDRYSIHYWELNHLDSFHEGVAASDTSFDRWYREQWLEISGIDLTVDKVTPPPVEKTFEWADREALSAASSFVSIVFLQPVLRPAELQEFNRQLAGLRHAEFVESRRRHGILRDIAFEQRLSDDLHVECAYWELLSGDSFRSLAESDDPFDRWYRQRVLLQHGVDLAALRELPCELVFEWPPAGSLAGL